MTGEEERAECIRREAGKWHVAMHSGEVGEETRAQFEAWLHADRDHKRAYRAFEQMYRDLGVLLPMSGVEARPAAREPLNRLARLVGGLAGGRPAYPLAALALMLGAVFVLALPRTVEAPSAPPAMAYATAIAEISDILLEDGSSATLGARSEMRAAFTDEYRRIDLISGEAFFDVAADPDRPFFVAVNNTLVRVIGTQFDVKNSRGLVKVSVLEGVVEVMKPDALPDRLVDGEISAAQRRVLTSGQTVRADRRADLSGVETVSSARLAQWRTGRLAYENALLSEIVSDLNRYHTRQIRFAPRDVGELRITISFAASDLDQVLDAVETLHPVAVERGAAEIRITPAP